MPINRSSLNFVGPDLSGKGGMGNAPKSELNLSPQVRAMVWLLLP